MHTVSAVCYPLLIDLSFLHTVHTTNIKPCSSLVGWCDTKTPNGIMPFAYNCHISFFLVFQNQTPEQVQEFRLTVRLLDGGPGDCLQGYWSAYATAAVRRHAVMARKYGRFRYVQSTLLPVPRSILKRSAWLFILLLVLFFTFLFLIEWVSEWECLIGCLTDWPTDQPINQPPDRLLTDQLID